MELKALEKAQRRLRVAQESAAALPDAENHRDFADKWYVFLHAAKGIYTTLEQGAKSTPQARQWFGKVNQIRKDDELLRYISEARNDDEHGIEEQTQAIPGASVLGISRPGENRVLRDQFGNTFFNIDGAAWEVGDGAMPLSKMPRITALDGKPVINAYRPARIVLKPVMDRSYRQYDPPRSHMGKDLQSDTALEVAELAIRYLSGLVVEAEGFCKPSP